MKKTVLAAAALAASLATPAVAQIVDGSFETQGAASISPSQFCYLGNGGSCAAGAWTSNGGGGFVGVNNGDWPGAQGEGSYHALIQGAGLLSQTFTAGSTGVFALSWLDAGRSAGGFNGPHEYSVTVNGFEVGSYTTDGQTVAGQVFTQRSSNAFSLTAGDTYIVNFKGIANGDTTSFIDNVGIAAAVPEPATWAMMLIGFGMAGFGLRRRAKPATTAALA